MTETLAPVEEPKLAPLERAVLVAQIEGLAANFDRWARFATGDDEGWFELQAIGWPVRRGSATRQMFAHAFGIESAVTLLDYAENAKPQGLYVIANAVHDSVTTRATANEWHGAQRGASTTDRDITHRRVLFIDVDAVRGSGTSATEEEMAHAVAVATAVHAHLAAQLPPDVAIGYGHSGNGRQVFVGLESTPEDKDLAGLFRDTLRRLDHQFSTATAKIDTSVCDAKRLVPAFGTTKRKGAADIIDRPHRRTAFVTSGSDRRATTEDLRRLCASLPDPTPPKSKGSSRLQARATRTALATARLPSTPAPAPKLAPRRNVYELANAVPIEDVVQELGLLEGDCVRCPGCGNTNGVAIVGNGLKCHHNSCAQRGPEGTPGYQTPVDVVMAARGLSSLDAAWSLAGASAEPIEAPDPEAMADAGAHADGLDVMAIEIGPAEHAIVERAVTAFVKLPDVYQRLGSLAHVIEEAMPNEALPRLRIRGLPEALTRTLLTVNIEWLKVKINQDGEPVSVRHHPPDWAVRAVHQRGAWSGLPTLAGFSETPILHLDGMIVEEPGYDPVTQLLYKPNTQFAPVPAVISQADAAKAARTLCEPLVDFPFIGEAHRAAAVAAMLTPLARSLFEGCVPLFAVDASTKGTGKGLLADVIVRVSSSRAAARQTLSPQEDEQRKMLTGVLLAGYPIVLFDNIAVQLGSAALDAFLTSETWSDRLLGGNDVKELVNRTMCVATGNNIAFGADTSRRVIPIRLRSPLEHPEDCEDFVHAKLRRWMRVHRAELAVAGLTILRGYLLAGRPDVGVRALGSFEEWSELVVSAVVWAGLANPLDTRADIDGGADLKTLGVQALQEAWVTVARSDFVSASEMVHRINNMPPELSREERRACLAAKAVLDEHVPQPLTAKGLGRFLRGERDRIIAGRYFTSRVLHGTQLWAVRSPAAIVNGCPSGSLTPSHLTEGDASLLP